MSKTAETKAIIGLQLSQLSRMLITIALGQHLKRITVIDVLAQKGVIDVVALIS